MYDDQASSGQLKRFDASSSSNDELSFQALPDLAHALIASYITQSAESSNALLHISQVSHYLMTMYGALLTSLKIGRKQGVFSFAALVSLLQRCTHIRSLTVNGGERFAGLTQALNQGVGKQWRNLVLKCSHDGDLSLTDHMDGLAAAIKQGALSALEQLNLEAVGRNLTYVFDAITPTTVPKLKILVLAPPDFVGEQEALVRLADRFLSFFASQEEDHRSKASLVLKGSAYFWQNVGPDLARRIFTSICPLLDSLGGVFGKLLSKHRAIAREVFPRIDLSKMEQLHVSSDKETAGGGAIADHCLFRFFAPLLESGAMPLLRKLGISHATVTGVPLDSLCNAIETKNLAKLEDLSLFNCVMVERDVDSLLSSFVNAGSSFPLKVLTLMDISWLTQHHQEGISSLANAFRQGACPQLTELKVQLDVGIDSLEAFAMPITEALRARGGNVKVDRESVALVRWKVQPSV